MKVSHMKANFSEGVEERIWLEGMGLLLVDLREDKLVSRLFSSVILDTTLVWLVWLDSDTQFPINTN